MAQQQEEIGYKLKCRCIMENWLGVWSGFVINENNLLW